MKNNDYDNHIAILFSDIYRNWRTAIDSQAKFFNLSLIEWHILGKLSCRGPKLSQLALSAFMGIDSAQLTRALSKLEEKGYIKKSLDQNDKRIRNIELVSPKADYIKALVGVNHRINETILSSLSEREHQLFVKLLKRVELLTDNLAEELEDA